MQNHEFFQKSSAPFEKISKSSPANINRYGQASSELVVRKSSHSDQKMQIDFSQSAFFILCGRLEAVSRYHPCTEGARGGSGFPEASVAELWGFPVVAAGSIGGACNTGHIRPKSEVHNEPPIFLYYEVICKANKRITAKFTLKDASFTSIIRKLCYFTGFFGLLGDCTASKTSAIFLLKIGSKSGTTTYLTTFVTKKLYSIRVFGTLRFSFYAK